MSVPVLLALCACAHLAEEREARARVEADLLSLQGRVAAQESALAALQGRVEVLESASPAPAGDPPAPEPDEQRSPLGRCAGEEGGVRVWARPAGLGADAFLRAFRVVPVKGERGGVRLSAMPRGGWAASCGLVNGDVLIFLDGRKVEGVDGALAAFAALLTRPAGEVALKLRRRQEPVELAIRIEEAEASPAP